MSTDPTLTPTAEVAETRGSLPSWRSVLAVVAHPDDESFGLGAVLDAFNRSGATVSVLCLTHGEASTLHGVPGDLRKLREVELQSAAATLGLASAVLADFADGTLVDVAPTLLENEVGEAIRRSRAEGLVVFDPSGVTGHADHVAATSASLTAASSADLPVLGWTVPRQVAEQLNREVGIPFVGHDRHDIDLTIPVERERQRVASLAHASQAMPTSVLWRRLELLGDVEHLRWLRRPPSRAGETPAPAGSPEPDALTMQVDYVSGDRFEMRIRDHTVTVDQPVAIGGEDTGPTPTELFVAGLASCVAFYVRRYLRRHKLDATGLRVETSYLMGVKPARVTEVDLRIHLPAGLPAERRDGLIAVASHCTVHNSITIAPQITVALA